MPTVIEEIPTRKSSCTVIMEYLYNKVLRSPDSDDPISPSYPLLSKSTVNSTSSTVKKPIQNKTQQEFKRGIVHIGDGFNTSSSSTDRKHSPITKRKHNDFFPKPPPKSPPKERYSVNDYEKQEILRRIIEDDEDIGKLIGKIQEEKAKAEKNKKTPSLWKKVSTTERTLLIISNIMPSIGVGFNYSTGIVSKLTADVVAGGAGIAIAGGPLTLVTISCLVLAAGVGFAFYRLATRPSIIEIGNTLNRIEISKQMKDLLEWQVQHAQYKAFRSLVRFQLDIENFERRLGYIKTDKQQTDYAARIRALKDKQNEFIDYLIGETDFKPNFENIKKLPNIGNKLDSDIEKHTNKYQVIREFRRNNIKKLITKTTTNINKRHTNPYIIKDENLDLACREYQSEIIACCPKTRSRKVNIQKPASRGSSIYAGVGAFLSSYGLGMGFLGIITGFGFGIGATPPGLIILSIALVVGSVIGTASYYLRKQSSKRNQELETLKVDIKNYVQNNKHLERRIRKTAELRSQVEREMSVIEREKDYQLDKKPDDYSPNSPSISEKSIFRNPSSEVGPNYNEHTDRVLYQADGFHTNPPRTAIG